RELAPGQVQPRVARDVVVAQHGQGHARRRRQVVVVAVGEVAADAQLEPLGPELRPRLASQEVTVGVEERYVLRPLLAEQGLEVEAGGGRLLLLVDGRRRLRGGGARRAERDGQGGGEGERQGHNRGAQHVTSRASAVGGA